MRGLCAIERIASYVLLPLIAQGAVVLKGSRGFSRVLRGGVLFISIGDASFGEVVGCHFHEDFIASEDADSIFTHFTGDVGGDLVLVFEGHAEHRVREQFGDDAGHFDEFFFGHFNPF